jgi:hypothetical protein
MTKGKGEATPNKDNLRLWAEALESDDFKQGLGALRTRDGGRCCLGVACDAFKRATGRGRWRKEPGTSDGHYAFQLTEGEGAEIALPGAVAGWLGLPGSTVFLPITEKERAKVRSQGASGQRGDEASAECVNDVLKLPFQVIAARIRRKFKLGARKKGGE